MYLNRKAISCSLSSAFKVVSVTILLCSFKAALKGTEDSEDNSERFLKIREKTTAEKVR